MKKAFFLSITFASLLLLWGCPYQSRIPLGQATETLNNKLIGSWIPEDESVKDNPPYYVIAASEANHYTIDHFEYKKSDSTYTAKNYVAHTTTIDAFIFLNMQEIGHKDYLLHRVEMNADGFTLYEVTDNIDETFSNEAEMQEFFKEYMDLSFFYNKDELVLVKKGND